MSSFTKSEENYIAHEVQIRLHDEKFKSIDKRFDRLDHKLNVIIGFVISGILLPVVLTYLKLI